jgi:hypothetical protein
MLEQTGISRFIRQPKLPDLTSLVSGHQPEQFIKAFEAADKYLREQQEMIAAMYDLLAYRLNGLPEALTVNFFRDNVAAGLTDDPLSNGLTTRGYLSDLPGSIVSVIVKSTEARTAGTLTVKVTVNGTDTGLQAVLDAASTTTTHTHVDQGKYIFTDHDMIGATVTTTGPWTPTTADIDVTLGVVYI